MSDAHVLASAEVAADRSARRRGSAPPRRPRRGARAHLVPLGAHDRDALPPRRGVRRRRRHGRQDGADGPPPRRLAGVRRVVGDRGGGRGVRALGLADRRRRRAPGRPARSEARTTRCSSPRRSATSATSRRAPSRPSPTATLICCEDTRRTGRLLQHAGVRAARLAVCNEHTEAARIGEVLDVLGDGGDVAVVSDAGTPGISDPGERLVRAALDAGYEVTTVPGPSAVVTALVTSGLPTARSCSRASCPRSGRARRERLAELAGEPRTIVIYEAPHRVVRTLADLAAALGADRRVSVSRELTKLLRDRGAGDARRRRPRRAAWRVRARRRRGTDR